VDQILSARDRMRPFEEAAQKLDDETRLLTTLKLTLRQREIDFQVPKKTIEILNTAEPARRRASPAGRSTSGSRGLSAWSSAWASRCSWSISTPASATSPTSRPAQAARARRHSLHRAPSDQAEDPDPAGQEPFRVLHTNLNLALKPGQAQRARHLFRRSRRGQVHHAAPAHPLMAAAGEKMILIDSDLRRPTQHRLATGRRSPASATCCWAADARRGPAARHRAQPRLHPQRRGRRLFAQPALRQPPARTHRRPARPLRQDHL
jgi:succinoglycan biosynthesis transport protein ExoP